MRILGLTSLTFVSKLQSLKLEMTILVIYNCYMFETILYILIQHLKLSLKLEVLTTHATYHLCMRASMIREKVWQLVTNEPVEFEKQPVEVLDCMKITDHFRGKYIIFFQFNKGKLEDVNM